MSVDMLTAEQFLSIDKAHNRMDLVELRDLSEAVGGGQRLLRHLTLASGEGHSLVERIQALQLSAAANMIDVMDRFKHLRGRQGDEDFAIEEEINAAMASHLEANGYTVSDGGGFPRAILGVKDKAIYRFDGMLLARDAGGQLWLYVGEAKHHLTGEDVRTAAAKVKRLAERLGHLQADTMPSGQLLYEAQLDFYKKLLGHGLEPANVQLFVGGTRIDEGAIKAAAAGGYLIIAPSGGGFGVVPASEVEVDRVGAEEGAEEV